MLAKRVIVLLTLSHGRLVRTKQFRIDRWYSLEFAGLGEADEIVVVDVTPGEPDRRGTAGTIHRLIEDCGIPVTLGGRLRTLDDARWAFKEAGADKVLSSDPKFCEAVSGKYGAQAVVWGCTLGLNAGAFMPECGEILVQSVERDGSLQGYDLGWVPTHVPAVIGSGCGNFGHMKAAFDAGADGAATSCVLHFSAAALRRCKEYLRGEGVAIRT